MWINYSGKSAASSKCWSTTTKTSSAAKTGVKIRPIARPWGSSHMSGHTWADNHRLESSLKLFEQLGNGRGRGLMLPGLNHSNRFSNWKFINHRILDMGYQTTKWYHLTAKRQRWIYKLYKVSCTERDRWKNVARIHRREDITAAPL